jgi:hypothetical protein
VAFLLQQVLYGGGGGRSDCNLFPFVRMHIMAKVQGNAPDPGSFKRLDGKSKATLLEVLKGLHDRGALSHATCPEWARTAPGVVEALAEHRAGTWVTDERAAQERMVGMALHLGVPMETLRPKLPPSYRHHPIAPATPAVPPATPAIAPAAVAAPATPAIAPPAAAVDGEGGPARSSAGPRKRARVGALGVVAPMLPRGEVAVASPGPAPAVAGVESVEDVARRGASKGLAPPRLVHLPVGGWAVLEERPGSCPVRVATLVLAFPLGPGA